LKGKEKGKGRETLFYQGQIEPRRKGMERMENITKVLKRRVV